MVCAICNDFEGKDTEDEERMPPRNHFVDNLSWNQIVRSADACYRCEILVRGCRGCFDQHHIEESHLARCNIRFYYPHRIEAEFEAACNKFLTFFLLDGRKFEVEWFADAREEDALPEEWCDWFQSGFRTSPRTDSDEALARVEGFVSHCLTDHVPYDDFTCQSPRNVALPTRILDIGDSDNPSVRLWETGGETGEYLCLSHCWGKDHIITTTKANLKTHQDQIPHEALPPTFRDAILVTRRLGFRYIWIDSLCIIQDDPRDWAVESSRMASVYSNCYLSIAATYSASARGGLFADTPDCPVSGATPSGQRYSLVFRERIDHHSEMTDMNARDLEHGHPTIERHPLLTRAWVFQERMLPARVLHFGSYEVWFECNGMQDCECSEIGWQIGIPDALTLNLKTEYSATLETHDNPRWRDGKPDQVRYCTGRLWRTMVSDYSCLGLTRHTDRLPAVGGLAATFASRRAGAYVAGLWEDTLQDDLIWTVDMREKEPRPWPPSAPTWSWASTASTVQYFDEILYTESEVGLDDLGPPRRHLATVEGFDVTSSSVNEFGEVAAGSITITGLLGEGGSAERPPRLRRGTRAAATPVCFHHDARVPMDADYRLEDPGPGHCGDGARVFCLRMSRVDGYNCEKLMSLVLRRSREEPGVFERIGTVTIIARPPPVDLVGVMFRGATVSTVTIR